MTSWFDYAGSQRFEAGIPTGEPKVPTVIKAKDGKDSSGREVGDLYPWPKTTASRLGARFSLVDWCKARRVPPDEGTRELYALVRVGYLEQDGIDPSGGPVFRRTPRFAGLLREN